jgi:uncharacterized membrane protein YfcA
LTTPATNVTCMDSRAAPWLRSAALPMMPIIMRNIDRNLFLRLAIPGIIGGAAGALLLAYIPTEAARIIVPAYLALMGIRILSRVRTAAPADPKSGRLTPLALAGGFLDAVGGGGWGPIVTSTLIARGGAPRYVIGTVNAAEFLVSLAITIVFFGALGFRFTLITLGLIIGGVIAAPIAALAVQRVSRTLAMILVGITVLLLALWNFINAIAPYIE